MSLLRALILRHRAFAMLLLAAAVCMKVALPAGMMIAPEAKVLTVQICDELLGNHAVKQVVVPMKDAGAEPGADQGKASCLFAAQPAAWLPGADPALLALALAFVLALVFAAAALPPARRTAFLRPPLRGPPLCA